MWIKILNYLPLFWISIYSIQCASIKRDEFVDFKSENETKINEINFSELNCSSIKPNLCLNLTKVTCLEQFGTLKSCSITNQNSTIQNSTTQIKTIFCNGNEQNSINGKGSCYQVFSIEISKISNYISNYSFDQQFFDNHQIKVKDPFDDPFFNDYKKRVKDPFDDPFFDDHKKRVKEMDQKSDFISKIFIIAIVLIFGISILCIILNVVNNVCFNGKHDLPCSDCDSGDGVHVSSGIATTSYR